MFTNDIPGFSIEEHVSPDIWFGDNEGIWEWKGPIILESQCAYGKFFAHKATFISRQWFLDFANYRRNGYDFDARYDDGLASYRDKELYDVLNKNAPVTSKRLKNIGDYRKGGKKGFDTIMNRLQEQAYILICDFVYQISKKGEFYGWGISEYTTPEKWWGSSFENNVYQLKPEESYDKVLNHLKAILPYCNEQSLKNILG